MEVGCEVLIPASPPLVLAFRLPVLLSEVSFWVRNWTEASLSRTCNALANLLSAGASNNSHAWHGYVIVG